MTAPDDERPPANGPLGPAKSYRSVSAMIRATQGDEAADRFDADRAARHLAEALAIRRALRGLTELEVAARLGWDAERVAAFEDGPDASLTLGDVAAYARAIGVEARLTLGAGGVGEGDVIVARIEPTGLPGRE